MLQNFFWIVYKCFYERHSLVSDLVFEGILWTDVDFSSPLLGLVCLQASITAADRLQNVTDRRLLVRVVQSVTSGPLQDTLLAVIVCDKLWGV